MINRKIVLLITGCIALLAGCTEINVAGGGSDNPDFVISGSVTNADGTPADNVIMSILPSSFDPVTDTSKTASLSATTNALGVYYLKVQSKGLYTLHGKNLLTGKRLLKTGIQVSSDSTNATVSVLKETGKVKISVLSEQSSADNDYVYVPGTKIVAYVKQGVDNVELDSIPEGIIPVVVYKKKATASVADMRYNIPVQAGKIAEVFNLAWKYSSQIQLNTTADGAGVNSDIVSFPVLVRLNAGNFDFSQVQNNGADIRFKKSDNKPLAYEIEQWDTINKLAVLWVNVDTIHGNNGTQFINMYWGNATVTDSSNGHSVFDSTNKFLGVWHMSEKPVVGSPSINDHTVNGHNATPSETMAAANSVAGAIGNAVNFDGKDDYLDAGVVDIPPQYSIGLWVKLDTEGIPQRFIFKDSCYTLWYDTVKNNSIRMEHMSTTTWWRGLLEDGGTAVSMTSGTWAFLTATFDGSTVKLYKNGTEISSTTTPITVVPRTSLAHLLFGRGWNIDYVNGTMDEIRIEGAARSSDWIKLCYMNQRSDDKLVQFK